MAGCGRFDGVMAMRATRIVTTVGLLGGLLAGAQPAFAQADTPTSTPTNTATRTPTRTPTSTPTFATPGTGINVTHHKMVGLSNLPGHGPTPITGTCNLYFANGKLYFNCGGTIYEVTAPTPS